MLKLKKLSLTALKKKQKRVKKNRRMSDYEKCLNLAKRYLAMREHSQFQIYNKLVNKNLGVDLINEVLKELQDGGFQSDERYTQEYIRYRQNTGYSSRKIIYELESNGISSELINNNEHYFIDDRDILSELVKYKILDKDISDQKVLMKLINHFRSKGFDNNIILEVINNVQDIEIYEK
jgi:regulatory protein|tara:strand:- start:375 stop:911 length:537 start_codon:yes stop_codon:yes gene_type:complete